MARGRQHRAGRDHGKPPPGAELRHREGAWPPRTSSHHPPKTSSHHPPRTSRHHPRAALGSGQGQQQPVDGEHWCSPCPSSSILLSTRMAHEICTKALLKSCIFKYSSDEFSNKRLFQETQLRIQPCPQGVSNLHQTLATCFHFAGDQSLFIKVTKLFSV